MSVRLSSIQYPIFWNAKKLRLQVEGNISKIEKQKDGHGGLKVGEVRIERRRVQRTRQSEMAWACLAGSTRSLTCLASRRSYNSQRICKLCTSVAIAISCN